MEIVTTTITDCPPTEISSAEVALLYPFGKKKSGKRRKKVKEKEEKKDREEKLLRRGE